MLKFIIISIILLVGLPVTSPQPRKTVEFDFDTANEKGSGDESEIGVPIRMTRIYRLTRESKINLIEAQTKGFPCSCDHGISSDICSKERTEKSIKIQFCVACDENFYLYNDRCLKKSEVDKLKKESFPCGCENGQASSKCAVDSNNDNLYEAEFQFCISCQDGYYLEEHRCLPGREDRRYRASRNKRKKVFSATYANDDPNTNNPCQPGFHVVDNLCVENECVCDYGNPAYGPDCPVHNSHKCIGCYEDEGFVLNFRTDRCEEKIECTCAHGIASQDFDQCRGVKRRELCQNCFVGFVLNRNKVCVEQVKPKPKPKPKPKSCICTNGNPATGSQCSIDGQHKCVGCHNGFHLDFKINRCLENQKCTCQNGTPIDNIEKCKFGPELCDYCDEGYARNLNQICIKKPSPKCVCENGNPATGELYCKINGSNQCVSCFDGFYLKFDKLGNGKCEEIKKCSCTNGVAETSTKKCWEGKEICHSCNQGYRMTRDWVCREIEKKCTCANGTAETSKNDCRDGKELCHSCNQGFQISLDRTCRKIIVVEPPTQAPSDSIEEFEPQLLDSPKPPEFNDTTPLHIKAHTAVLNTIRSCYCLNGTPAKGLDCNENIHKCQSCDEGLSLTRFDRCLEILYQGNTAKRPIRLTGFKMVIGFLILGLISLALLCCFIVVCTEILDRLLEIDPEEETKQGLDLMADRWDRIKRNSRERLANSEFGSSFTKSSSYVSGKSSMSKSKSIKSSTKQNSTNYSPTPISSPQPVLQTRNITSNNPNVRKPIDSVSSWTSETTNRSTFQKFVHPPNFGLETIDESTPDLSKIDQDMRSPIETPKPQKNQSMFQRFRQSFSNYSPNSQNYDNYNNQISESGWSNIDKMSNRYDSILDKKVQSETSFQSSAPSIISVIERIATKATTDMEKNRSRNTPLFRSRSDLISTRSGSKTSIIDTQQKSSTLPKKTKIYPTVVQTSLLDLITIEQPDPIRYMSASTHLSLESLLERQRQMNDSQMSYQSYKSSSYKRSSNRSEQINEKISEYSSDTELENSETVIELTPRSFENEPKPVGPEKSMDTSSLSGDLLSVVDSANIAAPISFESHRNQNDKSSSQSSQQEQKNLELQTAPMSFESQEIKNQKEISLSQSSEEQKNSEIEQAAPISFESKSISGISFPLPMKIPSSEPRIVSSESTSSLSPSSSSVENGAPGWFEKFPTPPPPPKSVEDDFKEENSNFNLVKGKFSSSPQNSDSQVRVTKSSSSASTSDSNSDSQITVKASNFQSTNRSITDSLSSEKDEKSFMKVSDSSDKKTLQSIEISYPTPSLLKRINDKKNGEGPSDGIFRPSTITESQNSKVSSVISEAKEDKTKIDEIQLITTQKKPKNKWSLIRTISNLTSRPSKKSKKEVLPSVNTDTNQANEEIEENSSSDSELPLPNQPKIEFADPSSSTSTENSFTLTKMNTEIQADKPTTVTKKSSRRKPPAVPNLLNQPKPYLSFAEEIETVSRSIKEKEPKYEPIPNPLILPKEESSESSISIPMSIIEQQFSNTLPESNDMTTNRKKPEKKLTATKSMWDEFNDSEEEGFQTPEPMAHTIAIAEPVESSESSVIEQTIPSFSHPESIDMTTYQKKPEKKLTVTKSMWDEFSD